MTGIKKYIETTATCAKCGARIGWYGAINKSTLIIWLRHNGWSVGTDKILCEKCRRKRKGERENER